jgi:hypothetical protein
MDSAAVLVEQVCRGGLKAHAVWELLNVWKLQKIPVIYCLGSIKEMKQHAKVQLVFSERVA